MIRGINGNAFSREYREFARGSEKNVGWMQSGELGVECMR